MNLDPGSRRDGMLTQMNGNFGDVSWHSTEFYVTNILTATPHNIDFHAITTVEYMSLLTSSFRL